MQVTVLAAGALTHSLERGKATVVADELTVTGLLHALVAEHGPRMRQELLTEDRLRDGLALLVNGRNVLSLPDRFDTSLNDGDEVLITIMVAGG